ncbi:c-type cytochrome biogenesis protein CcmI [Breoghania sp.]|uniref:c-type cytochrome biogenesis protein CcmI n=1 Tax=Breoghania sp. TaxID=2065378 RepID=UPI002633AD6E|nr:c-type cytochrome biogenesis protein CcmI [Breoghania sp.]MDJ0931852.1 c-type cytochrome biogenesis protein CcmI [Breoghania sp.]
MMIWFLFAVLTVAAALAILVPLARRPDKWSEGEPGEDSKPDVAIYKDQLSEIERDLERGDIEPKDVEAARTEIARRLLKAARTKEEAAPADKGGRRSLVAVAIAVVGVPVVAVSLYLTLGSPSMPDEPLTARVMSTDDGFHQFSDLVAKVEKRLAEKPDDGRGWDVIAPAYMRMGRAADAAKAYANAIRLVGENAPRHANQGEAIVAAHDGIVTEDARKAFERAAALAPKMVKPRFYLALGFGQQGKNEQAIAAWESLLKDADGNEVWVPMAQAELRGLGVDPATLGGSAPAGPMASAPAPQAQQSASGEDLKGPTVGDVEAAGEMSDEDRQAMIHGIVSQLDERLKEQGGTVDEWIRLVRAYVVLGEHELADEAVKRARADLKDDPDGLETIDALVKHLGL